MRKVLFILILILMTGITINVVANGVQIKDISLFGVNQIKSEDETINSLNAQLSELTVTKYPSTLKTLESSAEKMQKTKSEYENKALLLSDKDRHMQTEQYEIEFLWTRLGNYAKDNDVDIKIEVTASQISGRYDLNFTVTGAYPDVTQFIYDLENDSKLGFKVEKFNMVSDTNGVKATFSCTEIKIDIEITNKTTTQIPSTDGNNQNTTNTTNTTGGNTTNTTTNTAGTNATVNTNTSANTNTAN